MSFKVNWEIQKKINLHFFIKVTLIKVIPNLKYYL